MASDSADSILGHSGGNGDGLCPREGECLGGDAGDTADGAGGSRRREAAVSAGGSAARGAGGLARVGVHRCLGTGAFGSGCSLFAGEWTCAAWVRTVVPARGGVVALGRGSSHGAGDLAERAGTRRGRGGSRCGAMQALAAVRLLRGLKYTYKKERKPRRWRCVTRSGARPVGTDFLIPLISVRPMAKNASRLLV